jgi:hypothetical protein
MSTAKSVARLQKIFSNPALGKPSRPSKPTIIFSTSKRDKFVTMTVIEQRQYRLPLSIIKGACQHTRQSL